MEQISREIIIYIAIIYSSYEHEVIFILGCYFCLLANDGCGVEQRGRKTLLSANPHPSQHFNHGECGSKICLESVFIGNVLRRATIAPRLFPASYAREFIKGVWGPRAGGCGFQD